MGKGMLVIGLKVRDILSLKFPGILGCPRKGCGIHRCLEDVETINPGLHCEWFLLEGAAAPAEHIQFEIYP